MLTSCDKQNSKMVSGVSGRSTPWPVACQYGQLSPYLRGFSPVLQAVFYYIKHFMFNVVIKFSA